MKYILIGSLAMMAFTGHADEEALFETYELMIEEDKIHAICSFDQVDYFTTFSTQGEFIWEIPFAAKIVSWKKEATQLFVLSKARNGLAFFLSSIDTVNGKMLWEKGIYAPMPVADPQTTGN
jgi:hypothetical protein